MNKSFFARILAVFFSLALPLAGFSAEDKGNIKMRARLEVSKQNSKNHFSQMISANMDAPLSNSGGLNISASYFFTEKLASEVTLGVNRFKLRNSSNLASFYNSAQKVTDENNYSLPFSLGFQFYPVKFNHLNLYTGGGYTYAWTNNNKYAKLNNFHGPFAQAGLDVYNSRDLGVNFDVKKYFPANNRARYRRLGVNNLKLSNEISSSPWIFSGGITFKFGDEEK